MNFYIILTEAAFSNLPENSIPNEKITLIVDDVLYVPDYIKRQYHVISIINATDKIDKKACEKFTKEFEKNNVFEKYSSDIEPHINGIYGYVISTINNILLTIEIVVKDNDEIYLFGGNKKLKIGAYYAIKSPEFNKNVFFDRADVVNPFLYEALKNKNKKVKFNENAFVFSFLKYTVRVLILFCYSIIFNSKKYIAGCIKTKSSQKEDFTKKTLNYIIFPVRSNAQLDLTDSIASSMVISNDKVRPLVIYYEMLLGNSFFHRLATVPYSITTLFKYRYLIVLLALPFLSIISTVRSFLFLRQKKELKLTVGEYKYSFPLTYLAFENFAAPQVLFYEVILNKEVNSLISKKNGKIIGVCSTEMIGTQAFIERTVAKKNSLKIIGIQTAVVLDKFYPVKVVADNMFALSSKFAASINKTGVNNKGAAKFIGSLKYISANTKECTNTNKLNSILFATQPYEPELTAKFLISLSNWLNENMKGVILRIRLHPRDSAKNYSDIKNIEFVSNDETVSESVKKASLVLTRTSSVALDAIGYRVPYIACKLSNIDQKIDLDFLNYPSLSVNSISELTDKLFKYDEITHDLNVFIKNLSKQNYSPRGQEAIVEFLTVFKSKRDNEKI